MKKRPRHVYHSKQHSACWIKHDPKQKPRKLVEREQKDRFPTQNNQARFDLFEDCIWYTSMTSVGRRCLFVQKSGLSIWKISGFPWCPSAIGTSLTPRSSSLWSTSDTHGPILVESWEHPYDLTTFLQLSPETTQEVFRLEMSRICKGCTGIYFRDIQYTKHKHTYSISTCPVQTQSSPLHSVILLMDTASACLF